jgi:hypothetical protein
MVFNGLVGSEQGLKRIEISQSIEFRVGVDIFVVPIVEDQRPTLKPGGTQQVNSRGPVSERSSDPGARVAGTAEEVPVVSRRQHLSDAAGLCRVPGVHR